MRRLRRYLKPYPFDERRRRLASRQACPLHRAELIRDKGLSIARPINDDRQEKGLLAGHVMRPFDREVPLVPKVPFEALLGMLRDDRDE